MPKLGHHCVQLWVLNLLSVATAYVGYCMFVDLSQRAVLTAKDLYLYH